MSKNSRKEQQEMSAHLESLLEEDDAVAVERNELPNLKELAEEFEQDTLALSEKATGDARDAVINIASLYLTKDLMEKWPHVKTKMKSDMDSLSNVLVNREFLADIYKNAYKEFKVNGNSAPRMIEVITTTSKQLYEMDAQKSEFILMLETTYKQLRSDLEFMSNMEAEDDIEDVDSTTLSDGIQIRGLRGLNEEIKMLEQAEIQDDYVSAEKVDRGKRNPKVSSNTGSSIPNHIKYPDQSDDIIEKAKEEAENIESYFDDSQWND